MTLDGRHVSRIAGKLVEDSLKNFEASLKQLFSYDYHELTSDRLMHYRNDQ
jgi:hypothetical protein